MKRIFYLSILSLFTVIVCLSCSGAKEEERKEIIRPVRFQKVSLFGGEQSRSFSGVSKAAVETKLSFKVGGTIKALNAKVGQKIQKGKLIASISKTDYQLQYEQAKAAYKNAEVQMQSAKSAYERTAALYENNNVSLSDYERAKTAYESTKSIVNANKRSLQLTQTQLGYTNLYAPTDGIIAQVHAETNENIAPGQPIVEINSGNEIEVTVGVPESYITKIKEGEKATVQFTAIPDKKYQGIISEVSFSISSESSTFPVSIILTNPSKDIRPGMASSVTFEFKPEQKKSAIVVPLNAVAEDQKGRFVYTVTEEESGNALVRKKPVTTGELTSDGIEIIKGLRDGELVVTAGISKLSDGMKVKLLK